MAETAITKQQNIYTFEVSGCMWLHVVAMFSFVARCHRPNPLVVADLGVFIMWVLTTAWSTLMIFDEFIIFNLYSWKNKSVISILISKGSRSQIKIMLILSHLIFQISTISFSQRCSGKSGLSGNIFLIFLNIFRNKVWTQHNVNLKMYNQMLSI